MYIIKRKTETQESKKSKSYEERSGHGDSIRAEEEKVWEGFLLKKGDSMNENLEHFQEIEDGSLSTLLEVAGQH